MHKIDDIIILKGKSLKGKNRVHEHGEAWRITDICGEDVAFKKTGMLSIEPVEQKGKFPEGRWIHPTNDPDFSLRVN